MAEMDAVEALNHVARAVEEAMGEREIQAAPNVSWLPLSVRYAAAEAAAKVVIEWRESKVVIDQAAPAGIDLLTAEEREALDLSGKLANLCRRIVGSGPQAEWGVRCPRCGVHTKKKTAAEALADCPQRDYAAEDAEAKTKDRGSNGRSRDEP